MRHSNYTLNRLAHASPAWKTPYEQAKGQKSDVSAMLAFCWWEPVYYTADSSHPSQRKEKLGRWVGTALNLGDALTFLVLDNQSQKLVVRSAVRSALDPATPNLRAESPI